MVIDEMCMESVHSTSVLVYSSMTSLDICRGCGETASLRQDISDEFKEVIESIKGDGDKCRCVLNKARSIVWTGEPTEQEASPERADEIRVRTFQSIIDIVMMIF